MVFNGMFHPLSFYAAKIWVSDDRNAEPWACILAPGAQNVPKHVPTFNLINFDIPQKDIVIPYMAQTCHPLNS